MRVAALYDVHGNLPALRAVLEEVARAEVDLVVVGGDVVGGPLPRATLRALRDLELPVRWVRGNGDREVVAAFDALQVDRAPGGTSPAEVTAAWCAARLTGEERDFLAAFEATVSVDVDGLGPVLFCHGSPRSDSEVLTRVSPDDRLRDALAGVAEPVVVCGHTHQQFDRTVDGWRVLNAGSVGMPYEGDAAAFWLLLDGEASLRRTPYDVEAAAAELRASGFPDVDEIILRESLLEPADPAGVADFFERTLA